MRLWHQDLIEKLPRQQLLGQHRECAALRGRGWGKKHATVNYVFDHSPYRLYAYHCLVMEEMKKRGYQPDSNWLDKNYRGKSQDPYPDLAEEDLPNPLYPEHDEVYLVECLENLAQKGVLDL
ncbi:TIGR02328 family protein [Streptococcus oricebi]|uniref:Pyrimidine dimer DNA glycosylase n=1 Tax=Streptococcus oricebi TaxID=1547447 RepID=A0ABS5B0K4_9STRE|nr:TIGR02328 family protein [Streptococcus oricebi]MBP2622359.1 hypothetical protein [Streptococcus oricebi]